MSAVISDCGRYRYVLKREWLGGEGTCLFVMLNPSTADAIEDDRTIRRCIGFAQTWEFNQLAVGNLYALRATDPKKLALPGWEAVGERSRNGEGMKRAGSIYENRNDDWLRTLALEADEVVAAWGATPGPIAERPRDVFNLLAAHFGPVSCLGCTKDGFPRHRSTLLPTRSADRLECPA